MTFDPGFEFTEELDADWQDWYGSVLEEKLRRMKEEAIQRFAASHGLTEAQASQVAYYSWTGYPEAVQEKLVEALVNEQYDFTEAPWARDYEDARVVVKKLLGYGDLANGHNNFFYNYPEEVSGLLSLMEAERLGVTQENLDYLVFLAKNWHGRELARGPRRRRSNWDDLEEVSPYAK